MSADLIWRNSVAYGLQIGLLVGLAAFVPAVLRLRVPRSRLIYWHILLAACLLLPLLQPWREQAIAAAVQVSSVITAAQPAAPVGPRIRANEVALLVLAAGTAVRLVWMALGLLRLWRLRRRSRSHALATAWPATAELRISEDIASPVTFGLRKPVVLLPMGFAELDARTQDAILCHELLHVERRDWLFTVAEELVRAVFWFHPAIWWLLGEIQLAREQAVDHEVIERTQARDAYVDALLAIAGARPQPDLAPAPLFLRKRHLKQRVVYILKAGPPMTRARLLSALSAGLCVLAAACWLAASTFPLIAAPQDTGPSGTPTEPRPKGAVIGRQAEFSSPDHQSDRRGRLAHTHAETQPDAPGPKPGEPAEPKPGTGIEKPGTRSEMQPDSDLEIPEPKAEAERLRVGGNVQQTKLVRQPRPLYPPAAKEMRLQGVVKLSAVIGTDGTIKELEVLSGHPLLVESALEAVKQWVYEPTFLNGNAVEVVTQIDVNYTLSY